MTSLRLQKWNANSLSSPWRWPATLPCAPLAGDDDDVEDDDFAWDEDEEDQLPGKDLDKTTEDDDGFDDDDVDDDEL